ncbi:NahK/ErcS family hybrid sensor histidine kinase/response regulator [Marinobacter caseinilyticus]|uniref:NahK/ErcS family hybrid sensor histidine kinase/response regulator n=1 Tax=Marinobacter caseinilyticus TaxID=2692195 RepID=UPI001407B39B|nr:NahK/ErcS family hybrid sensor histidine kinase/response regulator [Marinobacter caseinilyticus]
MKKPSDPIAGSYDVGDLLGLGSQSARKSYYPALQDRIEELESERNRYKWLFENALHGIFQGDLKGGFLSVNPAMARIVGYDSPEHLSQRVIRLREQFFWQVSEFDQLRHELLAIGKLNVREVVLRRADGRPVNVAITVLRRPDLGVEVVEAFVADITERHQARLKLEQLNADLERRVEERTEALQNANVGLRYHIEEREKTERELTIAVNAAEEANRSKDKYLAAASHDLLQPLNAARLLVSTLQDSPLPVRESRLIEQVHRALEGAEDLLADLLDISKLDQHAMQPDLTNIDAYELVYGLAEEFDPVARAARLGFRQRLTNGVVRTDPRMLTRILRNLLSNAFRYTPSGHVLLAMRRRQDQLRIEVWDTGVGIAQEKLSDIFTEFHQLLPPESGGRKGVGLGLAIVERMARMLDCSITVDSIPGKGSRFVLTLPLEPAVNAQPGPVIAPVVASGSLEGSRVLVIDNEPAILVSMEALLERWGCRVAVAASAEAAVAVCRALSFEPQAILADFHLDHGRTGCEAIDTVRHALAAHIPAAIITADRSDLCRQTLQLKNLPVLNKPVKPNRLRALLSSLVSPSELPL